MSWSVAAMPWVLWAVDRLVEIPGPPRLMVLAIAVAFQALAGEPVTLSATAAVLLATHSLFAAQTEQCKSKPAPR